MIIVGDIACPSLELSEQLENIFLQNQNVFKNKTLIGNLEGLVCDSKEYLNSKTPILYNHSAAIKTLEKVGFKALGLANNHTLDLPQSFDKTVEKLNECNIQFSGAGKSKLAASKPVLINENNCKIALFFMCWDFLLYNQQNPSKGIHVSLLQENQFLDVIKQYRIKHPQHKIIVYPHWSFDLETLPFPMYRQWSKKLIDLGVNCIVACHSHCVQGGEKYKDGYIIYGLGNFFIPNAVFVSGNLKYPNFSSMQLAFEWNPKTNKAQCHWLEYKNIDTQHKLIYKGTESMDNAPILSKYSPFQKLSETEYLKYFKNNRRKNKLVPIYKDYKSIKTNYIKTFLLTRRAKIARALAKARLISWQN